MNFITKKFFNALYAILIVSGYPISSNGSDATMDSTTEVICNIIGYVWGIGGPLMTVVIIGASLLAIFGRMPWPALFALGMFCGVFFGAKTIIMKVIPNISTEAQDTLKKCANK
ncbi:MAG: TrbC/VirB2 family protein [Wolbachia endosymbiont of Meromenopon meropis]|nr:TrbC/VirB2 family protein [Wolbachia endosymbiont of Meromenopon meropis]